MEKPNLINHMIRYGLILGLFNVIISLLIYVIDENLMVKWWFGIGILVVNIAIIIYSGIQYRKSLGGYIKFKDAFVVTFLVFIFAGLISLVYNVIQYEVIDPDLATRLDKAIVEQTEKMMTNMGAPQERIDEQIEKMEGTFAERFTAVGLIKQFFTVSLAVNIVVSLIIGLIIQKKEPEIQG
jgi:hypothetical protein